MKTRKAEGEKTISGGLVLILFIIGAILLGLLGGVIEGSLELGLAIMIIAPFIVLTTYFVISHHVRGQISHPILEGIGLGFIFGFLVSFVLFHLETGEGQFAAIAIGMILITLWSFMGWIIGLIYAAFNKAEASFSGKSSNQDEQLPADMR